jgi:hypothetical protein
MPCITSPRSGHGPRGRGRTGIAWEDLPAEMGCGCGMTCRRRLRDWHAAAVAGLQHGHGLAGLLEPVARRQAGEAGADDAHLRLDLVHARSP